MSEDNITYANFKYKKDENTDLLTMNAFINELNGSGYDDAEFKIYITACRSYGGKDILGYYLSFYHAELDIYYTACKGKKGSQEPKIMTLNSAVKYLERLDDKSKTVTLIFSNDEDW